MVYFCTLVLVISISSRTTNIRTTSLSQIFTTFLENRKESRKRHQIEDYSERKGKRFGRGDRANCL